MRNLSKNQKFGSAIDVTKINVKNLLKHFILWNKNTSFNRRLEYKELVQLLTIVLLSLSMTNTRVLNGQQFYPLDVLFCNTK